MGGRVTEDHRGCEIKERESVCIIYIYISTKHSYVDVADGGVMYIMVFFMLLMMLMKAMV